MPYIYYETQPLATGRTVSGITYREDDGSEWAGEVEELREGDSEIAAEQYAAIVAANDEYNAALPPPPPPPSRPDGPAFKVAAYGYLGMAAFTMPLAGFITPVVDALNASNWALAREIIGLAAQAKALTANQYTDLLALLAAHNIPEA